MDRLEELKALYEGYLRQTEELLEKRNPVHNFFGIDRPGTAPCHKEFVERVETLMLRLAEDLPAEKTPEVLRYIFEAPDANRQNELAYWMLLAVHGKAVPLFRKLLPEDASVLLTWYEKRFPRRQRLPVQKDVVKRLKALAK